MPDDLKLWVLSVEALGVVLSVTVNDVTVCDRRTGARTAFGEKINPLLVEGKNRVHVSLGLAPPLRPSAPKSQPPDPFPPDPPTQPKFKLKVQQGAQGTDPGEAGILVQYEWKPGQPPLTVGQSSTVLDQTFDIAHLPWPPPEWTRGASIRVDPAALEMFVRSYADRLRSRDIDGAVELNRMKFQDLARSMGFSEPHLVDGFRGYLGGLMAAPDWSVSVAAGLHYALEGQSRLIRITGADGAAPISVSSNGHGLPFDLTVASIGGNWRIVR
jgi:hypothetical protein